MKNLPIVEFKLTGTQIASNIDLCLNAALELEKTEIGKPLVTDQDFAEKEALNKSIKAARSKLKTTLGDLKSEFVTYSDFADAAKQLDSILQKVQSDGEKTVKAAKTARKKELIATYEQKVQEFVSGYKFKVSDFTEMEYSFEKAIKGKKTFNGVEDALKNEFDRVVTVTAQKLEQIQHNLDQLSEIQQSYKKLFADWRSLVVKDSDAVSAIIGARIKEFELELQAQKIAAERKAEKDAEILMQQKLEAERKAAADKYARKEAARKAAEEKKIAGAKAAEEKRIEVIKAKAKAEAEKKAAAELAEAEKQKAAEDAKAAEEIKADEITPEEAPKFDGFPGMESESIINNVKKYAAKKAEELEKRISTPKIMTETDTAVAVYNDTQTLNDLLMNGALKDGFEQRLTPEVFRQLSTMVDETIIELIQSLESAM